MTASIIDLLPVGSKYEGNGTVFHVRAVVDDHFVVKHWRKSKQYWQYECVSISVLQDTLPFIKVRTK